MPALVLKVSLRLEASGLSGFGSFKAIRCFGGWLACGPFTERRRSHLLQPTP